MVQTCELLATVIASEIFNVLKQKQPYNQEQFIAALKKLPRLPWE